MSVELKEGLSGCSVIIPTADRGLLLSECLASVFRQTLKPVEVIVVDNGRVDAVIPDKYKSSVTVVRTAALIGPGKARNIGAKAAGSEYIAFLDDDDYWVEDYLEKMHRKCIQTGAGVVVAQLKRRSSDDVLRSYKLMPVDGFEQRCVYFRNPGFGGQNIMLRRETFISLGGFDEKLPASVDRDLAARLLQSGEAIHVEPEAIAVLRDHAGPRVRASQVKGNYLFIKKHMKYMSFTELARAVATLIRRYAKYRLAKKAVR